MLDALDIGARVERSQGAARRSIGVSKLARVVADVGAVDEAQGWVEVGLDFLDADTALEPGRVRRPDADSPSTVVAVASFGRALLIPSLGLERATVRQTRVLVAEVDTGDA